MKSTAMFFAILHLMMGVPLRAAEEALRTWTSQSGKTVEARFQAAKNGKVLLKNADDWALSIPIQSLSVEDQAYIALKLNPPENASADEPAERSAEAAPPMKDEPARSEAAEGEKSEGETEEEVDDEAMATTGSTAQQLKTYKFGDTEVKGYLRYVFKNGTAAVVFPRHRTGIEWYHARLGRTYRMTIGGYPDRLQYSRMVIDDVMVRPPNVRVRYREVGYDFLPEGYSIEERKQLEKKDLLQGEIRLTFKPDGLSYRSFAKALVENAPRHFVHFHVPEVSLNTGFRGSQEEFKKAFAGSQLQLNLKAAPKKTLQVDLGEKLVSMVNAYRKKYDIPTEPKGYLGVHFYKRAGMGRFSCEIKGEQKEYLNVSTYGHEPIERRSWIGHHGYYDKGRFNFIPHPVERVEYIRMKKGTVVDVSGTVLLE